MKHRSRTPHRRRALVAAVTVGALLAAVGCTSGPAPTPTTTASVSSENWDEFGPIVYAQGKDASGTVKAQVAEWNKANPNEQVELRELSESPEEQRTAMVERAQAKSGEFAVMAIDVVWTTEFAANGWLEELPAERFPTAGYLKTVVNTGTYSDTLYAMPSTSDGALFYYRKDLLDKAGLKPPTTWAELQAACDKVLPGQSGMSCYAGQFDKYEGLTSNVAEAINSAGGAILNAQGQPTVNTPEALAGLNWIVDGFTSGRIPAAAKTWQEEESRAAFQSGKLLFQRNWPYVYELALKDDRIAGRFAVTPLPGKDGPGVSTLGGQNLGISTFARNKGTALKFVNWMQAAEQQQRRLEKASLAPVLESLYDEPALQARIPYLQILGDSIRTAKPRPKAVRYSTDVSRAIQDEAYAAIEGTKDPQTALNDLQAKLEALVK
ncbi:MAG: ABC transporter substrate-binding protein [Micropruina sp.]